MYVRQYPHTLPLTPHLAVGSAGDYTDLRDNLDGVDRALYCYTFFVV